MCNRIENLGFAGVGEGGLGFRLLPIREIESEEEKVILRPESCNVISPIL